MKTPRALAAAAILALALPACSSCSSKKEEPVPLPIDPPPASTPAQTAPAASSVGIVPIGYPAGVSPATLADAITATKPQMADSTAGPDAGSTTLGRYWAEKKYPWAQLEAVSATTPVVVLTSADTERGKRVCEGGVVQQLSPTSPAPNNQYEGLIATKEGTLLSLGAVGDVAGIKQGAAARFCGVVSGVQTLTAPDGKQSKALRLTGMFDTPANHGGGGVNQLAGLEKCCAALQQNAASMPVPQNGYALGAAQYCRGALAMATSPQKKQELLAQLSSQLKGVPLPLACR